ncbi:hypothetical protein [Streptomyces longisporoflavus]|uniref:Lipoprotein n=1 Tax=Streptomyces longisporoflavus TaxID=28044 RepID=A0ABW7R3H1_9ACTN
MSRTRTNAVTAGALLLGLITACGAASHQDKPDGRPEGAVDEASPSSSTPLTYVEAESVSRFDVTRPDGTTYTVTVNTGLIRQAERGLATGDTPYRAEDDATMSGDGLIDILGGEPGGCGDDVDLSGNSRDAVMPFTVNLTDNTPGGFVARPEFFVDVYKRDELLRETDGVRLMYERNGGGKYHCGETRGSGSQAGSSLGGMSSEGDARSPGWIILKDYYSPGNPEGDRKKFMGVELSFDVENGGYETVYDEQGGALFIVRERNPAAADGSTYTSRAYMNLLTVGRHKFPPVQ